MSEFNRVEAATYSPTVCALCGDHEGPFIDTNIDLPAYGHVWICCANDRRSGCIRQMAQLDDMTPPEIVDRYAEKLDDAERELKELRAELGNRRVSLKVIREALQDADAAA